MRRREFLALPVAAAVLSACGDTTSTSTGGSGAAAGRFPVTVEHGLGTTRIASAPQRIVSVGLTEQDTLLQLGHVPVGVTEWYGDQPSATWPWAAPLLEGAKPTVLDQTDGIQFERVAALRPDLIVGVNASLKRADYEKLSQIAPTIAGPKGGTAYFSPWRDQLDLLARAVGQPEAAGRITAEVEAAYAKAARANPDFAGKVATFSQGGFYQGDLYVYPPGLNTDFLSDLGFEVNPRLKGLSEPGVQVQLSAERLPLIDTDVIVFATEKDGVLAELDKVATFRQLDAVRENRAIFTDPTLAGAIYFLTPLSLMYVVERLPALLADAVAGKAPHRVVRA